MMSFQIIFWDVIVLFNACQKRGFCMNQCTFSLNSVFYLAVSPEKVVYLFGYVTGLELGQKQRKELLPLFKVLEQVEHVWHSKS